MNLKNQKGVAIIIVVSALMFLTIVVFDFFKSARFSHQMALNYRSRVQAYYMAKSGLNFSILLLYNNKKIESDLKKKKVNLSEIGFQPLYKQVPLNTKMIRDMSSGIPTSTDSETDGTDSGEEKGNQKDEKTTDNTDEGGISGGQEDSSMSQGVGLLQKEQIDAFLDFEGDFDTEINEEQSKYSVNATSKMTSTSTSYDLHKKILLSILLREDFKNFFEDQEIDAAALVHAISDFIDANNTINEFDKVERGNEDSLYDDVPYKVKNAPYLTLSELRLVHGMSDDIYEVLKNMVTIYHTSEKINVCMAEQGVVDALIVHFTRFSECTTPLEADDESEIEKLRDALLSQCPDTTAMVNALYLQLGLKEPTDTATTLTTTDTTKTTNNNTKTQPKTVSTKIPGCKIQFDELISEDNNIFNIRSTGEVNGVRTVINEVIDATSTQAKSWKTLYYQVD